MKTTILALIAAAGAANAGLVEVVDISGTQTWDAEGSITNTVLSVDLGGPASVTSVGWDLSQTAGLDTEGASWLSEMTIGIDWDQDGTNDLFITPSETNAPGTESNSSGGLLVLGDLSLPNGIVSGSFNLEFFESFVDEDGAAEGVFNQGSSLSFGYVPAPGAAAVLGLGGLVAARRRR